MLLSYTAILLLSLLQAAASRTASAPVGTGLERPLRVLTWNIQGCAGRLEPVLAELQRQHADVVCLQEAEVGTTRTNGSDQAAAIARRLGLHQVSDGSAFTNSKGEQRMAILARWPLEKPEPLDVGTGRIYGLTAVVRPDGKPIRLVCIHLTNSYWRGIKSVLNTERASIREAADLTRRLRAWGSPTILAGDFNAVLPMREHDLIARRLTRVPSTQPTYPAERPALPVDHIYYSTGLRVLAFRVTQTAVSDHCPLIAEFHLDSPPATAPAR